MVSIIDTQVSFHALHTKIYFSWGWCHQQNNRSGSNDSQFIIPTWNLEKKYIILKRTINLFKVYFLAHVLITIRSSCLVKYFFKEVTYENILKLLAIFIHLSITFHSKRRDCSLFVCLTSGRCWCISLSPFKIPPNLLSQKLS